MLGIVEDEDWMMANERESVLRIVRVDSKVAPMTEQSIRREESRASERIPDLYVLLK